MLVVPIKGDIITTEDGDEFTVAGFTNFKTQGPAVYVKSSASIDTDASSSSKTLPIYFFDIKNLNGIKVEYNNSSKVLNALGMLKRKHHLPQKDDFIFIEDEVDEESDNTTTSKKVKVKDIKLHNKNIGLSRGLVVRGDDEVIYSLASINKIKRSHGDSFFDKSQFLKLYKDYLGYNGKHK